jgi:superfamily II DNA/RNA helicase
MLFTDKRTEVTLVRLIQDLDIDQALVFVHNNYFIAKLFHELQAHNIPCVTLSAAGDKLRRQQAIEALKTRQARVLVATGTIRASGGSRDRWSQARTAWARRLCTP